MKAEDLRIGNLINDRGEIKKVYHLDYGGKTAYRINDIAISKKTGLCLKSNEEIFKPIPLTEEWLIKMGTKRLLYNDCIETDEYEFNRWITLTKVGGNTNTYQLCLSARYLPVNINYVHQFQNIIFGLTQTELIIKL